MIKQHPLEKYPPKEKAKDIFLPSKNPNNKTACLLLHGFTVSPYTLKPLAEYLHEKGFTVSVPRLPGHGTHPSDLEKMTFEDWLYSARNALQELTKNSKNIIVVGTSLGGNLTMRLANEYPDLVKGIVLVGTSIKLRKHFLIKNFLPFVTKFKKSVSKKQPLKENLEKYLEEGNYNIMPLRSVAEILKLIYQYSLQDMKILTHPSLVIHSHDDKVVHYQSSKLIYDNIRSETKELIIIESAEHYPIINTHGNEVLDKIHQFILRLVNSAPRERGGQKNE